MIAVSGRPEQVEKAMHLVEVNGAPPVAIPARARYR